MFSQPFDVLIDFTASVSYQEVVNRCLLQPEQLEKAEGSGYCPGMVMVGFVTNYLFRITNFPVGKGASKPRSVFRQINF